MHDPATYIHGASNRETTSLGGLPVLVSMADVHPAGSEWMLTPENWSGRAEVVSALDGGVTNAGVERYGQLEGRHLDPVGPRTLGVSQPIKVGVGDDVRELRPGDRCTFELPSATPAEHQQANG